MLFVELQNSMIKIFSIQVGYTFCGTISGDLFWVDIKADNVFIEWKHDQDGIIIERVQLGDLEDAAHIPPGSHMIGKHAGNWMWGSPEAHAKGPVNKPSDIFSFALVISLSSISTPINSWILRGLFTFHIVHLRDA
jgi:hypothetical protein